MANIIFWVAIAVLASAFVLTLGILLFFYRRLNRYASNAMTAMIQAGEQQGIKIDKDALLAEYRKNVAQQEKDEKRLRYLEGAFSRLVYLKETLYDRGGVMTIFDFKKLLISVISEE